MSSGVFYPAASTDDGYITTNNEFFAGGNPVIYAGSWPGETQTCWCRPVNLSLSQGAQVSSCFLRIKANGAASVTPCQVSIRFVLQADPAAPTSVADLQSRPLTSGSVAWTIPPLTDNETADSPDLSSLLQEVVDQSGYAPGQAVLLFLVGTVANGAYRTYSPFSYSGGGEKPELHADWTDVAPCFRIPVRIPAPVTPNTAPALLVPVSCKAPSQSATSQPPAIGTPVSLAAPSWSMGSSVPVLSSRVFIPTPASVFAVPAEQLPAAQIIYTLTLSGDADGLDDITLPMASFQTRLQDGGYTNLEAVIPNSPLWASSISDRAHGEIVIRKGFRLRDGSVNLSEIARATYDSLAWVRGGTGDTAIIYGIGQTPTGASKAVPVAGVQYKAMDTTGKRRLRAEVSPFLAPGDLCKLPDGDQWIVGEITHYVATGSSFMEVTEA